MNIVLQHITNNHIVALVFTLVTTWFFLVHTTKQRKIGNTAIQIDL